MSRRWKTALIALVLVIAGAQFVRPALDNPPPAATPSWDSPRTEALARRACFDCHSNETLYPWYSRIAPARWLVAHHVAEGREHLNFSDIVGVEEGDEMAEEIRKGAMPTWDYRLLHAEARLAPAEQDSLVAGLLRTFGGDEAGAHGRHEEGRELRR